MFYILVRSTVLQNFLIRLWMILPFIA